MSQQEQSTHQADVEALNHVRSVIIDQIDVDDISLDKSKNNSPVTRNRYAPILREFISQAVEWVARQIKVFRAYGDIEPV